MLQCLVFFRIFLIIIGVIFFPISSYEYAFLSMILLIVLLGSLYSIRETQYQISYIKITSSSKLEFHRRCVLHPKDMYCYKTKHISYVYRMKHKIIIYGVIERLRYNKDTLENKGKTRIVKKLVILNMFDGQNELITTLGRVAKIYA